MTKTNAVNVITKWLAKFSDGSYVYVDTVARAYDVAVTARKQLQSLRKSAVYASK